MDNLRIIIKTRGIEILATIIDILYLCVWVAAQAGAAYIIQKISIDEWLRLCFQGIFGGSTLAVVGIHMWEDITRIWIRAKARIKREREEMTNRQMDKDNGATNKETK